MRKRANLKVMKATVTEGKTTDWIPLESQGKIAQAPPLPASLRTASSNTSRPISELELPGAELGPPRTDPIPRLNLTAAGATHNKGPPKFKPSSKEKEDKRQYSGTHWYASSV
jgi:hypothetical protein